MSNQTSTSDEILSCARTLIVSGGYNGFSYADIANVVGIRKPSIHHHFPSKVDLVRTLVARYREEVETGIASLERQVSDPLDLIRKYTGFWEACIMDSSMPFCVCALLASELPALPEQVALEVRAHFRSLSTWLTSVFERGAQQGSIQFANSPRVEAEALMATVHGAMLSARAYGDPNVFGLVVTPHLDRLTPRH
jgi:TetR/AcrR family transcriptional regulator, transcriptional repressor for nem operon